jgi:hypothetical protein
VRVTLGAVARPLAVLATAIGEYEDAAAHLHKALELNEHMCARPWPALTQEGYGRMLLDRGRRQDASEGGWRLEQALGAHRGLGMPLDARRALEALAGLPAPGTRR